jgi:hypothetical protein
MHVNSAITGTARKIAGATRHSAGVQSMCARNSSLSCGV